MAFASLLLSSVVLIEVYGLSETGNLVLLTHLADVAGDFVFYGVILLFALLSWKKDSSGREHEHNHPEEMVAAVVNLAILFVGLVIATIAAISNLWQPEEAEGWLAVIGPLLAIACYIAIYRIVQNEDKSFSKSLVDAHLLGDLLTSSVVTVVSFGVICTGWALLNPLGALAIVPILGFIFIRKVGEYRTETKGSKVVIRGS